MIVMLRDGKKREWGREGDRRRAACVPTVGERVLNERGADMGWEKGAMA